MQAQGHFALESAVDELAYATRIDPVELRLHNDTDAATMANAGASVLLAAQAAREKAVELALMTSWLWLAAAAWFWRPLLFRASNAQASPPENRQGLRLASVAALRAVSPNTLRRTEATNRRAISPAGRRRVRRAL
jgi:CO/xanthine dehydrogenase Mo-binding subunit